jgi:hypothetical protein
VTTYYLKLQVYKRLFPAPKVAISGVDFAGPHILVSIASLITQGLCVWQMAEVGYTVDLSVDWQVQNKDRILSGSHTFGWYSDRLYQLIV